MKWNGEVKRLQIPVTSKQRDVIKDAAKRAGTDLNTWSVAQMMSAAKPYSDDEDGGPVVLSGSTWSLLRKAAEEQGVLPDALVRQLLVVRR